MIFKSILDAAPTPAIRLNPEVPPELERILKRPSKKTARCATRAPLTCARTWPG